MKKTVYITYNPGNEIEESTSLRLQTLSSLYGYKVNLPYRVSSKFLTRENKTRIDNSKFILAFCLENLSQSLKEELKYAISKRKPIVVIYDNALGKTINFKKNKNIKEVFVDFDDTDKALHDISGFLQKSLVRNIKSVTKKNKADISFGTALIGIGLGLLALWVLARDE